jgi:hypothetical protein
LRVSRGDVSKARAREKELVNLLGASIKYAQRSVGEGTVSIVANCNKLAEVPRFGIGYFDESCEECLHQTYEKLPVLEFHKFKLDDDGGVQFPK